MEEATEETSAQALDENGGSVALSSRPENEENSLSAPLPRTTLSYLPVSSPVAPPPELVERLRQRQEENRNIPHASPRNEEDERKTSTPSVVDCIGSVRIRPCSYRGHSW